MNGGKISSEIKIDLRGDSGDLLRVYIDVYDCSLSRKWLPALELLLQDRYLLEKNYCFLGWHLSARNGEFILQQINQSISAINRAELGYTIDDWFDLDNSLIPGAAEWDRPGQLPDQDKMNRLHRYFEDLQGQWGAISEFAAKADAETKWHIRQLNLLCHEFENWALSNRKAIVAPEWRRPSQIMCWLNAPRFTLDREDLDLFGIETLNRSTGGVYVGVNKGVGKHHFEVFMDEGKNIDHLVTSTLSSHVVAAGDFDIEWGKDPATFEWQQQNLQRFREWLITNGFDPADPYLTIGHPKVAQVDLMRSFGTTDLDEIWNHLNAHLDVFAIHTENVSAEFPYRWQDHDFVQNQIAAIFEKDRSHAMVEKYHR